MAKRDSFSRDLIKGAVAGAVATALMGRVSTYLYEKENYRAKRTEVSARGGKTSFETAAEKGAHIAGVHLTPDERKKAGSAVHWTVGVGAGALYGILRRRFRGIDWAQGLGFGIGFWLLLDETLTPAAGLTPGPAAFPWQTHARGLAAHLAYGLATDSALDVLDRVA